MKTVRERSLMRRLRAWWYDYEWPVVAVVAAAVVVLGVVGFRIHHIAQGTPVILSDLVFRSFQLFLLQIDVTPPMPWQLDVARMAAPLVGGYTALQALAALFAQQLSSLRLRRVRNHVVVCGLGEKGYRLAQRFLDRGDRVVVVEIEDGNDNLRPSRDQGAMIVLGDASETEVLMRAHVARAACVIAVCGDDGANATVAGTMCSPPSECHPSLSTVLIHIADPDLFSLLTPVSASVADECSFRLAYFNVFACGARGLLCQFPLDSAPAGAGRNEIVLVGAGPMARAIALEAAVARTAELAPLRIVAPDAVERVAEWRLKHRVLESDRTIVPHGMSFESPEFLAAGFAARARMVVVCMDDDTRGLPAALRLSLALEPHDVPVVACLDKTDGLPMLLGQDTSASGSRRNLRLFGLLDHVCDPQRLLSLRELRCGCDGVSPVKGGTDADGE